MYILDYMTAGTQMLICDDQCSTITGIVEMCQFLSNVSAPSDPFFEYLRMFNCSDPTTYLIQGIPINDMECIPLANFSKSTHMKVHIKLSNCVADTGPKVY